MDTGRNIPVTGRKKEVSHSLSRRRRSTGYLTPRAMRTAEAEANPDAAHCYMDILIGRDMGKNDAGDREGAEKRVRSERHRLGSGFCGKSSGVETIRPGRDGLAGRVAPGATEHDPVVIRAARRSLRFSTLEMRNSRRNGGEGGAPGPSARAGRVFLVLRGGNIGNWVRILPFMKGVHCATRRLVVFQADFDLDQARMRPFAAPRDRPSRGMYRAG